MFKLIIIIILIILIINSKPYKVWWMGRNKTEDQKKAIKFLIYGPKRSKISRDDYDNLSYKMYDDYKIFEMAKRKLGITDNDLVIHPYKKINSKFLCQRNYIKMGEKVLFHDLSINEFRSSRMDCLMVMFGKNKLYFYQLSFRTNKTHEIEETYSYDYDKINHFYVNEINSNNGNVFASIKLITDFTKDFPSLSMRQDEFERWQAVGTHLDSPELRETYKDKTDIEKKSIRYFTAYYNLPLAISDSEYEDLIAEMLPAEKLKDTAMDKLDLTDKDIRFAAPISFRSFIYNNDTLEIQGKDGYWRSNIPQFTWIFFCKDRVALYFASFQMDNSVKRSSNEEIFYDHITSIRTEETSKEKISGDTRHILSYYKFIINYSGNSIAVTLPILSDENDKKIKGMKSLLREVKQSKPSGRKHQEEEDLA